MNIALHISICFDKIMETEGKERLAFFMFLHKKGGDDYDGNILLRIVGCHSYIFRKRNKKITARLSGYFHK